MPENAARPTISRSSVSDSVDRNGIVRDGLNLRRVDLKMRSYENRYRRHASMPRWIEQGA
jgi:hypothetical protein